MAMGIVGLAVLVVVVLIVVAMTAGGRGAGWIAALVGLAVLGAAAFLLAWPAPKMSFAPAPVAVQANPRAAAPSPAGLEAAVRSVRGRVLKGEEGEVPFAGATVEAADAAAGPAGFLAPLATGRSGDDGGFVLEGLPERDVRVRAVQPGHAGAAAEAPAASTGPVVLRLVPGAAVAGRVLDRETRAAVAGAEVSWGGALSAKSDAEGRFRLEPVAADRTALTVRAKGYARHTEGVRVPEKGRDGVEVLLRPASSIAGTVLGPDGAPFAGAKLEIEMLLDSPLVKGLAVPSGIDDAASGPDGKYLVDDVPAGRTLRLRARTGSLMSESAEAGPLEKGVPKDGVDLRLLPAGAVLATVVDDRGVPVAGADVTVTPAGENEGLRAGFVRANVRRDDAGRATDERGFVRVGPLAPGPVTVRASRDDYRTAESPLLAVAGTETPITLTLAGGVLVAGRVVDPSGAPVPGATVTVSRFGAGSAPVREERTADAEGRFRAGGLEGRPFLLRAEAKGFVTTSLNNVEPGGEVVVTLHPGGIVAGVVTDAGGAAVPKFRVHLKKQGDAAVNPMDWERFAGAMGGEPFEDPAGKFLVDGLEPGTYAVEVRAQDLAPGRAEGVAVEAGKESRIEVRLQAGLELQGVVVRRSDGSAVAGARLKIPADGFFGEFDMGDPADLGLDGLEGTDAPGLDEARETLGGFARANAVSGADGRFSFKGLEAGSVRLMVSSKGLAPATVKGIEVPAAGDVRVELGEEAGIEGTVTDAQGAPKSGAMVMLQRIPVFMRFATTDVEGRYRIGGVGAGTYLFYVMEQPGGGPSLNMRSESVVLEEGKTLRKDHRLGEGTKVVGRITRGGKPVTGVMVMLFPASRSGGPMGMLTGGGGSGFAMGSSKDDGTYEITGVSPGRYTVSVQTGMGGAPGGGEPLDVPRGATEVRRDVVIPEYGIRGVVTDETGKPVTGAAVSAVEGGRDLTKLTDLGSAMESMGGQGFTDDEGRFSIANVKAVSYRLQVQAEGFESEIVENVVASEGGAEIRVALRRGLEVVVRVLGPSGTPVRGASLFVADAEGRELTNLRNFDAVKSGEDGRVTLRVPPGNLKFEAVAGGFAPGETVAAVPASGEIVVRLPKGAGVKVTVAGANGAPVPGAGVELVDAEGRPYAQRFSFENVAELLGGSSTGSDGVWQRRDLPAGAWKVRAALPDGRSAEESVTLVEGETAQVTVTLR